MIEILAAGGVAAVGSGLAYLYYRGGNAEEETDSTGTADDPWTSEDVDDYTASFDGLDSVGNDDEDKDDADDTEEIVSDDADAEDAEDEDDGPGEAGDYYVEEEIEEEVTVGDVNEDVEEQADPTPEYVTEMEALVEIKGVGPAKAEVLEEAGYVTPEDVFYANDEDLADLDTFGEYTVEQIREDIGRLPVEATA